MPLVHEHAIGEPAAPDDAEDAVADRESMCGRPTRDHGAGDLDPGYVGRRAGWGGIAALTLRDISGVQAGVAHCDENVVAARNGVGPVDEIDDLVAACTGVDDCPHSVSVCDRTRGRVGTLAPSVRGRSSTATLIPGGIHVARCCLRPNHA